MPNTGVISADCRGHQEQCSPNEASCSSESSLSWLQMDQLRDDEKPRVCGTKLRLCIWLDPLYRRKAPAIQFYLKYKRSPEACAWSWQTSFYQIFRGKKGEEKKKTRKLIRNIQSGLGNPLNVGNIPILIKYMLAFSWAINFKVNWKTWNSRNSWGHRQHVSLIIAHESALTSVIEGYRWPLNSAQEFQ